ncbi:hypothetical protein WOC76_13485 [Methylocystis sp. IM3]|uniref:hypothetical protein n=1 Tax=unclassified Methylocystis TaxID=2625913 RepID=UPI00311A655F
MFRRVAALAAPLLFPLATGAAPLDCAKATNAPWTVICANPTLKELEKEASRLAGLAGAGAHATPASRRELARSQASVQKTLAACDGAEPCLRRTLIERVHGLRQGYADARSRDPEGISRGPRVLACPGFDALIAVTFVGSDPALVFLAWRDKGVVLMQTAPKSGAPYAGAFGMGEARLSIQDKQATLGLPEKPPLDCDLQEGG